MSEQMEKLVEEIYLGLSAVDWGFQRKDAEEIIARVGKAYASGLEIPGEEWRGPAEDMDSVALLTYDGIIIGLRKEENK